MGNQIPHLAMQCQVLINHLYTVFIIHQTRTHALFQKRKQIMRIGKRMVKSVPNTAEQHKVCRAQLQCQNNPKLHVGFVFFWSELPNGIFFRLIIFQNLEAVESNPPTIIGVNAQCLCMTHPTIAADDRICAIHSSHKAVISDFRSRKRITFIVIYTP